MSAYNDQSQEQQGGIQGCAAYRCPCGGTINLGGNDWYCRHHARRPVSLFDTITAALDQHGKLVREISRGYSVIASEKEISIDRLRTIAFEQAESLVTSMYEAPLNLLNEEPDDNKCWPSDYRAWIRGIESLLSVEVANAISKQRSAA